MFVCMRGRVKYVCKCKSVWILKIVVWYERKEASKRRRGSFYKPLNHASGACEAFVTRFNMVNQLKKEGE